MNTVAGGIAILVGVGIIYALSLYITHTTGQLSMGHGALAAVGAYLSSILTVNFKVPLVLALLAACLVSAVIGVLIGFPSLRIRGLYLALATLGFGEIVRVFFSHWDYVGGVAGFTGMKGLTVEMVAIVTVIVFVLLWLVMNSSLGRAFEAISEDEAVAEALGLNITFLKVLAFALGAGIAGVGGALYAHFMFFISPEAFDYRLSVLMILYVFFGGQTVWGAAFGGALLVLLPQLLSNLQSFWPFFYGGLFIAIMILRAEGIITRDVTRRARGVALAASTLLVRLPR